MKPTLPDDHDLEKLSAEVSKGYRASAQDEPPAQLDAAILAAARREVRRPQPLRNWQVPASIAAVLVIGVSVVLMVRDKEPPLPSLDRPAADEAKLAKPAPPRLAMKAIPGSKVDLLREDRPSRERKTRPDREPAARDQYAVTPETTAAGTPSPAVAPAAAVVAETAKSAEQKVTEMAQSGEVSSNNRAKEALADAAPRAPFRIQASRKKEQAMLALPPADWLEKIDILLRDGKEAEARRQLLELRQQYPHYPLPERVQALLPTDQR